MKKYFILVAVIFLFIGCAKKVGGYPAIWTSKLAKQMNKKTPYRINLVPTRNDYKLTIYHATYNNDTVFYDASTNVFNTLNSELSNNEVLEYFFDEICNTYPMDQMIERGLKLNYNISDGSNTEKRINLLISKEKCQKYGYMN